MCVCVALCQSPIYVKKKMERSCFPAHAVLDHDSRCSPANLLSHSHSSYLCQLGGTVLDCRTTVRVKCNVHIMALPLGFSIFLLMILQKASCLFTLHPRHSLPNIGMTKLEEGVDFAGNYIQVFRVLSLVSCLCPSRPSGWVHPRIKFLSRASSGLGKQVTIHSC